MNIRGWGLLFSFFGAISSGFAWAETKPSLEVNELGSAIMISPRNGPYDKSVAQADGQSIDQYKNYLVSKKNPGLLQIFISDGFAAKVRTNSNTTGAQVFMVFPRRQAPKLTREADGSAVIEMVTGQKMRISAQTGRISSIDGMKIQETQAATMASHGGVKIQQISGMLVLDGGFRMGASPFAPSKAPRESTFRDEAGHACGVSNSELFTWTKMGDFVFKFASDSALGTFLKKRCPQLDLRALSQAKAAVGEKKSGVLTGNGPETPTRRDSKRLSPAVEAIARDLEAEASRSEAQGKAAQ